MFMHIVSHLSGRITALFTQALVSLKALLCKLANNLRVSFSQASQSVVNLLRHHLLRLSLLVPTVLLQKKGLLAEKIKLALSRIKENKTVQTLTVHQLIQAGSKLAGLAKQLPQRVRQVFKKGQ
jgi:hypothetical protein